MVCHRHAHPCFLDKACRLLCYAFFVLSLGRRTKKEGDISMFRGEEQVFPNLNGRHAEERLRIGIRGFPRSLNNNNIIFLKEKDNEKINDEKNENG